MEIGIYAGVKALIVVADPGGKELHRHRDAAGARERPRQPKLRALQRKAALPGQPVGLRRPGASCNRPGWQRTQRESSRAHARGAARDLSTPNRNATSCTSRIGQTHAVIGAERSSHQKHDGRRWLTQCAAQPRAGRRWTSASVFRQLDYKTGWYGSRVVKADRWFPSSKLCSGCGVVKAQAAPGRANLRMRQLRPHDRPRSQRGGQPGQVRTTPNGPECRGRHGWSRP